MDTQGKKTRKIVEIAEIDIPLTRSRLLLDEENEVESHVVQHGFEPDRYEIVLEKKNGRYQVVTGTGALRGIQGLHAKGFATPTKVEVTILKKSPYQLFIIRIEAHPKRYLVFASLLLLFLLFYWFQLRPAQIRQSCGNFSGGYYTKCLHKKGVDQ